MLKIVLTLERNTSTAALPQENCQINIKKNLYVLNTFDLGAE